MRRTTDELTHYHLHDGVQDEIFSDESHCGFVFGQFVLAHVESRGISAQPAWRKKKLFQFDGQEVDKKINFKPVIHWGGSIDPSRQITEYPRHIEEHQFLKNLFQGIFFLGDKFLSFLVD